MKLFEVTRDENTWHGIFIEEDDYVMFEVDYFRHRTLAAPYLGWLHKNIGNEACWGYNGPTHSYGLQDGMWYLHVDRSSGERAIIFNSKEDAQRYMSVWAVHMRMKAE